MQLSMLSLQAFGASAMEERAMWDTLRNHRRAFVLIVSTAGLPEFNVPKGGDKRSELRTQERPCSRKDPHVRGTLVTPRTQWHR